MSNKPPFYALIETIPSKGADAPLPEAEAAARVMADYARYAGQLVLINPNVGITGYTINGDSLDVINPLEPIVVRVDHKQSKQCLLHRVDNFIDPYWDVEPIQEYEGLKGLRSFWTFGPSYEIDDTR